MTMCFVFGSNEGGFHGAGAALEATKNHGAVMGIGYGHTGDSFAIPTKDRTIRNTLPLDKIETYIEGFLAYAAGRPDLTFKVTRLGCGLAGLKDEDIAPMFRHAPRNCYFDEVWHSILTKDIERDRRFNFWGTF